VSVLALKGTIAKFTSLVDGTVRYTIDVSPMDDNTEFHKVNTDVAVALLNLPQHENVGGAVDVPREVSPTPPGTPAPPAPRKKWDELSETQQAGIRCAEATFWEFMGAANTHECAEKVRVECGVTSRSQLSTEDWAAELWMRLEARYQGYLAEQRYGDV
jgi:hypothetical protein